MVVGAAPTKAHAHNSVHGAVECEAAGFDGSCSHSSWIASQPGLSTSTKSRVLLSKCSLNLTAMCVHYEACSQRKLSVLYSCWFACATCWPETSAARAWQSLLHGLARRHHAVSRYQYVHQVQVRIQVKLLVTTPWQPCHDAVLVRCKLGVSTSS